MKNNWILGLLVLAVSCQSQGDDTDQTTGNVLEVAPAQSELDEIALQEQPQLIKDFFAIDSTIIGSDFCYTYDEVSQLILHGNKSTDTWNKYEISDHYLTVNHKQCDVLLEFMTFELNGKKKAFLSQMNQGKQQFNYLNWDSKNGLWYNSTNYPKPNLTAYFENLSAKEKQLVNEYGFDFIYINPQEKGATFVYSEWSMMMNMGEKQMDQFSSPVRHEFELKTDSNQFILEEIDLSSEAGDSTLVYL